MTQVNESSLLRSLAGILGFTVAILAITSHSSAAETQSDVDAFVNETLQACLEWVRDGSLDRIEANWTVSKVTADERRLAQSYPDFPVTDPSYDHPIYNVTLTAQTLSELAMRKCNLMGLRSEFPITHQAVTLDPTFLQLAFRTWSDHHGPDLGFARWQEAWDMRTTPQISAPLIALRACPPEGVLMIEGFEVLGPKDITIQDWQMSVESIGFEKGDGMAKIESFLAAIRTKHCADKLASR